jgi:hypothetical protein
MMCSLGELLLAVHRFAASALVTGTINPINFRSGQSLAKMFFKRSDLERPPAPSTCSASLADVSFALSSGIRLFF